MHGASRGESLRRQQRRRRARVATLALAVVLDAAAGPPRSAHAQFDLSGLWRVGVFGTELAAGVSDVCSVTIVGTGTALSMNGPCEGPTHPLSLTGALDPGTGAVTGSGSAGNCPVVAFNGSVAGDSRTFTGTFTCTTSGTTGGLNAGRCGNGQIDSGETCDDSNLIDGDCCTSRCVQAPAGAGCADDGNPCTSDTCDAEGECQHPPLSATCNDGNACTLGDSCVAGHCVGATQPDDSPCNDGNACTTGDHCVGGACTSQPVVCPTCLSCNTTLGCTPTISTGCKEAPDSSIVLRRSSSDALAWKWRRGSATLPAELGSPTTTTDYDFCVYDGDTDPSGSPRLLVSARAAAGSNWSPAVGGFRFTSNDAAPDGLRRLRLKSGAAGRSQVLVRGKGANLQLPPPQSIVQPVTVQLKSRDGANSQCWSAVYGQEATSSPLLFRAGRRPRRAETPPNILIISLDDTRADGVDRMPTLARLASEGVSFTNSFVVDPLCAPSRASLLTGQHASRHGVRALGGAIGGAQLFRQQGSDRQTIATWLQAAGYMTGLFGKYVNGYGFAAEQLQGPGGTVYVPPGWTRWRAMASPEHFGGVRGTPYTLVDEHGVPTLYDDRSTDRQYGTDLTAAELRAFIADAASQARPFLAVWTPYASHVELPRLLPEPAARHFGFFRSLAGWRPPSWNEADVSDKPRWVRTLHPDEFSAVILNDVIRIGAYETLLSVDEQLRAVLDDLAQLGVDRNTVIIFTSDNGAGWGEHRIFFQAKECPYEECLRVPMIVRDPRVGVAGVSYDAAVLNLDIAPTVAALAGVTPPVPTDGTSLTPWLSGSPPPLWRDMFLLEHWRGNRGDAVDYSGQVTDGDQVRILYGDARAQPRASALFEFDSGGGVTAGAVAVPIGADADTSVANLGTAIVATVPFTWRLHVTANNRLSILDNSPDHSGVYVVVERDQGSVMAHDYLLGDYVGVRDVAGGFTYVEHESGEVELYDLGADPWQLDNRAADPAYAATRENLALRLEDLLR